MAEWKTGDVITAERLNGMVEPLIIHSIEEGTVVTFDKTWKEIKDAFMMGIPCIQDFSNESMPVRSYLCIGVSKDEYSQSSQYDVIMCDGYSFQAYSTDSENGYPHASFD